MFDPISLGAGGLLVLAGWALGRFPRRGSRPDTTPQPVCRCSHGMEHHDPETKKCHASVLRNRKWAEDQWTECTCRQYNGPKPVEELFANQPLPPAG
ncbi:hypothetical protein [Amycolatopsis sp. NPDC004079]|uniref:hypothetical protein n=1 Tax=Amycolatopsis sp. NPDC004079 TaxID=3154549 RepID=UPI0033BB535F